MVKIGSTMNHRRMNMRKGLLFVVAALLVVALPLSALAGTEVYRVVDQPFNHFFIDPQYGPIFVCFDQNTVIGQKFGGIAVCVEYVNVTYSSTVRFKTNKDNTQDLGWNTVARGTVRIWEGSSIPVGNVVNSMADGMMFTAYKSDANSGLLDEGPFQMEEVAQDDGNDYGCNASDPEYFSCSPPVVNGEPAGFIDYLMFHWKFTGNKYLYFKMAYRAGSTWCMTDLTTGQDLCVSY